MLWRAAGDTESYSVTLGDPMLRIRYPPHASCLKTVPRTVFLTTLTLSGFEPPKGLSNTSKHIYSLAFLKKKHSIRGYCALARCGGHRIIFCHPRRPNASHSVPASRFVSKNSPPDCFLNDTHPLRVRAPKRLIKYFKTHIFSGFSKEKAQHPRILCFGALRGTRTLDLLVRSQLLYPAELAAHIVFYDLNILSHLFINCKHKFDYL